MKRNNHYIMTLLLAFTLFMTACEKIEPDFFDENTQGAYFDYEYAYQFERVVNFRDYTIGEPQEVPVKINIKLLGYLTDEARTLSIKTKAVDDYELAQITVPEVKFADKEYQKEIEVLVKRPDVENDTTAVCVYIDSDGDLDSWIDGKNEFTIYITESYEKPSNWSETVNSYMGTWSTENHKFLANFTNDNYYYNKFYDNENMLDKQDVMKDLNERIVNSVLAGEIETPISGDVPFLANIYNPKYNEPYFWKDCPEEIGVFYIKKFLTLNRKLDISTIKNVIETYTSEEAGNYIKENANEIHKEDVLFMMDEYYRYSRLGYTFHEYKEAFWIGLKKSVIYNVRIPYWWEDPDKLGCKDVVEKYFGEYYHIDKDGKQRDDKYRFMLEAMMTERGTENFIIAELFPFTADLANYTWSWDASAGGEEKIKECYKIIKAAYDKVPAGIFDFTFPELNIE